MNAENPGESRRSRLANRARIVPAGRLGPMLRGFRAVLLGALLLWAGGCGTADEGNANANAAEEQQAEPIVKSAERGPVELTVTADKDTISIAERLTVTVEAVAQPGVDVELQGLNEEQSGFQIRDFSSRPPEELEDGRRKWFRQYVLGIFVSGEYSVPAITAEFIDRRKEDTGAASPDEKAAEGQESAQESAGGEAEDDGVIRSKVSTEPFTITVTSLLEGEFDPTEFEDIKGPVELPAEKQEQPFPWLAVDIAAGVVLVVAIVLFVMWRRRRPVRQIVIPPHEWAFDQLRKLIDAQLIEQGLVQEFYYQLTYIVRVYIELRFGLMAPERTTEEFLVEAHRSHALGPDQRTGLGNFLTAADMVKYARYSPSATEIEQAFNAARDFIQQTAPGPQPGGGSNHPRQQSTEVSG